VVGGQPFVVADGAPVARDPGQCALDHPPTGQDLEGVQVTRAIDDLEGELERGLGSGDQLARVAAVGPGQLDQGKALRRFHSRGLAASRSCTLAAVTSTVSSRPSTPTAMCRLRPCTFLPASYPRLDRATFPAALTDWESMIAAEGTRLRPASRRARSRSWPCMVSAEPSACHLAAQ
jgi:hypothetical protein